MKWARTHWIAIATAAVLFLVGLGIGSAGGDSKSATKTTLTVTEMVVTQTVVNGKSLLANPEVPVAKPAASGTIEGDGTFLVGKDIAPGTYSSAKPSSGDCYWERLRDLDSSGNSVITNNDSTGPSVMHVARTDYAVKTEGCETFRRIK